MQRRWVLALAGLGLGFMTVALTMIVAAPGRSRTPLPLPWPTQASLSREREAEFRLPGSKELLRGGNEAEWSLEAGPLPAMTWRQYGVDAEWDEVVAYVDGALKEQAWRDGGCSSELTSMQEWDVVAWHTDDRILRLGHNRDSAAPGAGSFHVIYEVTLIGEGLSPGCIDE